MLLKLHWMDFPSNKIGWFSILIYQFMLLSVQNPMYRVFQKTCNNFLLLLKLGLSRNELKLYIIFKPITIQLC